MCDHKEAGLNVRIQLDDSMLGVGVEPSMLSVGLRRDGEVSVDAGDFRRSDVNIGGRNGVAQIGHVVRHGIVVGVHQYASNQLGH